MQKRKKKLFNQLDNGRIKLINPFVDFRNGRSIYEEFVGRYEVKSNYEKGTLGYFADELKKPSEVLIKQFSDAGISGLTPEHYLTELDKKVLLNYLKKSFSEKKDIKTECLYSNVDSISSQILVVQSITNEVMKMIAKEPSSIYDLPSRRFEELVAKIFEDQGYEVSLTPEKKDGGYDILCRSNEKLLNLLFLVECKKYARNRPVGVEVVRGLFGVTEMKKANFGMIVTTSSFTKGAQMEKLQMGSRMNLKEFDDLKKWLSVYQ